jgi:hypothetical protein
MFGLRLTTDCQPRTKNGHPPQSTTGVASTSCTQVAVAGESTRSRGLPGIRSAIPIASVGIVSATPIQKRRVISRSSSFSGSSAVIVNGSSAMPQIGHDPGASRTISGCIGQVHLVDAVGIRPSTSSERPEPVEERDPGSGNRDPVEAGGKSGLWVPRATRTADFEASVAGSGLTYRAGLASNLALQPFPQK